MKHDETTEAFKVWACDNQIYGPITLPILLQWVMEGRVSFNTWIYLEGNQEWRTASRIESLREFLPQDDATVFLDRPDTESRGITTEELRQFEVLSGLANDELADLIRVGEVQAPAAGERIIKQGDPGDALYFVLTGGVRVRLIVGGQDKILANIPAGEFFGEMAMFTQSARSADVLAEDGTRLLRFSAESFRQLIAEKPAVAARMLFAIAGTMANRISEDNRRIKNQIASDFLWS